MYNLKGFALTISILSIFSCTKSDLSPEQRGSQVNLHSTSTVTTVLPGSVNLHLGLLGYWSFTGNAKDSSEYGAHGVVSKATLTTDRKGKKNSAYYFDGKKNTNITIKPTTFLSLRGDFTISSWFLTYSDITWEGRIQMIVSKMGDGIGQPSGYTYGLWGSNGSPMVNFQANPYNNSMTYPTGNTGVVSKNKWYNLIVTYHKATSTLSYYLNDKLIDTKKLTFSFLLTDNPLVIGEQLTSYNVNRNFHGKIDEVRIYNRVLFRNEITAIYKR
jgi:hypothetical protein